MIINNFFLIDKFSNFIFYILSPILYNFLQQLCCICCSANKRAANATKTFGYWSVARPAGWKQKRA